MTAASDAAVVVREDTAPDTGRPSAGSAPNVRTPKARTTHPRDARRAALLTVLALDVLTALGALVRAQGFSGLGFFRDDAWAALSARQGLGTAVHMWVTAPGYLFFQRAFMLATPHTTTWAQIPAFVAGVACIPAMYALTRWFGLSRVAGLVTAAVVSLSPAAAEYSTRVKDYEADVLLACLVLALGEATRRRPETRQAAALAVASVGAFLCSASVAPVIAGVWLMIAWCTLRTRPRPRPVVLSAIAAAVGVGAVALMYSVTVSPKIQLAWLDGFIVHSSPSAMVHSLSSVTWRLLAPLFGFTGFSRAAETLVMVAWLGLSLIGLYRNAAMLGPALAVAVAYLASAAHRVPLGTGRTDLYLYPAMLLLLAAGVTTVLRAAVAGERDLTRGGARAAAVVVLGLSLVAAGFLLDRTVAHRPDYPGVDVHGLVAAVARQEQPGDRVFVSELARFPWAYESGLPVTLRFGRQWSTGFTVESRDPRVFIAPSEYYEGDSHPAVWAAAERGAHRLWYVWSPPLAGLSPSYAALRVDGWRPVRTLHATGVTATLLVHR